MRSLVHSALLVEYGFILDRDSEEHIVEASGTWFRGIEHSHDLGHVRLVVVGEFGLVHGIGGGGVLGHGVGGGVLGRGVGGGDVGEEES